MITFDQKSRCLKLDTDHTSYVIAICDDEGFLGHAYYGEKISDADVAYLLRTEEHPFIPSKNNRDRLAILDSFPTEFPGNGVGDFRESAIAVRDKNNHSAVQMTYVSHEIMDGKPSLPGLPATFPGEEKVQTLAIHVADATLSLEGTLFYSVFEKEDVITRSVFVKNASDETIFLTKLFSMSLDMDAENYQMLTLHGGWGKERQLDFRPIGFGKQSAGSIRGVSSPQEHPFLGLVDHNATQESGSVYGFHFIYSGNFLAQVEKSQFGSLRVQMGIHPENFCFALKPGEGFQAPEAVMTFTTGGIGQMSRNFHDLYREHLIRSPYRTKERPILINNWEATYFDFDTEKLLDIAREAKKAGIEMLVMDDGWFGNRNDDNTSLGDWKVNERKLPGGLKYLADEVNKIGLKFGVWFEPEMVSSDSELYRAHPDWAIAIPGRKPCPARNQYVLDLTRPEVFDYVYESVASNLRAANIEYVKWDMNRYLTDLGSAYLGKENQGEVNHRFVLAVYALQEKLTAEFPNLLLENCSSGGARFDPGMLYYSPQIWCSDNTDAIERLVIQEGTALLYPLSTMGAHVSDCPNHNIGRITPFETRGNVALAGTFGYELDITKISDEERAQIPEQVATYHKYHALISSGDYYRLASYQQNHFFDCFAVVAKDKSEALLDIVQVLGRTNERSRRLKLYGLDSMKRYRIEGEEKTYSGDTLMHAGILVPGMKGDFLSRLIHIVEVDGDVS